jgi:hypothetical protein
MSAQYRLAAAVAALGFAVEGVAVIGHKIPDSDWGTRGSIVDGAFAVAALAVALALPAFARRLQVGRAGAIGRIAAQVGYVAMAVESWASLAHGGNTLGPVFSVGLLLVFGGLLALAVSGVKAGIVRWAAPLPVLGMLVGIAGGDQGGSIALAVVWLVIAAHVDRPAAAALPAAATAG